MNWKQLALLVSLGALCMAASGADDYEAEILKWQEGRETRLGAADGWLTISGFAWLEFGENPFGSDPNYLIRMAEDAAPAHAGVLFYDPESRTITVKAAKGVDVQVDSVTVTEAVLDPTADDTQIISVGRVTFWIIDRGGRYAVRMQDPECSILKEFTGIDNFPIDPAYRVIGKVNPASAGMIEVPSMLGYTDSSYTHGAVEFTLNGVPIRLFGTSESADDSTLFFVFSDATSGEETYGGGRFLYTRIEPNGEVVMDFNRAYNPPCAFNPFTTCPLPPAGNDLSLAIRAGEMAYKGGGAH